MFTIKYFFLFFVLLPPTFSSAQTPSIYDDWTAWYMGTIMHFSISEHTIIVTQPASKSKSSSLMKSDTIMLLKVVYDSAKAKGTLFTKEERKGADSASFLLKDNGEGKLGSGHHSEGVTSIFNSKRVAEFQKLKDPLTMRKDEAISMIHFFGDSLLALIQPSSPGINKSQDEIIFGNMQHIIFNLSIAHGYNPLSVLSVLEKFKDDSDISAALKLVQNKIQESPAFREANNRNQKILDEENIKAQAGQLNNVYQQRLDLIPNLVAALKGTHKLSGKSLKEIIDARSIAAGLWLTPEIIKDSLAFAQFERVQDHLSQAIWNLFKTIDKKPNPITDKNITVLLSQIEAQENRIRIEQQRYNDLVSPMSDNSGYQSFKLKPLKAEMLQFEKKKDETYDTECEGLSEEPKPINKIKIKYPSEAKKQSIQGKVTFSMLIGKDGKVIKVIVDKSDNDIFRQPVMDAAMKIRFTPGKMGKERVKVWYTETVRFKLDSDVAEPIHH